MRNHIAGFKMVAVVAASLIAGAAPAAVSVITFDDVGPDNSSSNIEAIAAYGGLTWSGPGFGWIAVSPEAECPATCGFQNGRTSGGYVGVNGFNSVGTISAANPFRAVSVQLGSAWNDNMTVTFDGYLGGSLVWTQIEIANATATKLIAFNSGLIDELRVLAVGGTPVYFGGSGPRMVFDDLRVDLAPVPEPRTWLMMIAGFALAGQGLRRRKRNRQYALA